MTVARQIERESRSALDLRHLADSVWTSPQITVEDVADLAEQGFALIVNNRPDEEVDERQAGSAIRAAAERAGIEYLAIPVDHWGLYELQVVKLASALRKTRGKVLTYCRSGTRSTFLWALASASTGREPQQIIADAEAAGYDVTLVQDALEALAARPTGRRASR